MTNPADVKDLNVLVERGRELMNKAAFLSSLATWRTALDISKQRLGAEDPQTLFIMEEMAACLERLGRWSEAVFFWGLAYNLSKKLHGADECTVTIARHAAFACMELNQRSRAIPYWQEALAGSQRLYGDLNPTTLFCIKHYARCLAAEKRHDEVLQIVLPVMNGLESGVPVPPKYGRSICHSTAQALTALRRYDDAVRYWERYCNMCSDSPVQDIRAAVNGIRQWASALGHAGRHEQASALLERCQRLAGDLPGGNGSLSAQIAGMLTKSRKRETIAA